MIFYMNEILFRLEKIDKTMVSQGKRNQLHH